jgi:hypothetical protein
VLVGLGAAGSAGNASAMLALFFLFRATEDVARDGMGDTRVLAADDEAHGVCPGFAPTLRPDDAAGNAGNGIPPDEDAVLFQLACLLTAERDDCVVELFSFKTLEPPCADGPPLKESPVAAPGSEG